MPRTNIAVRAYPGGDSGTGTLFTPSPADAVAFNETLLTEGMKLIAYNPTAGDLTVTVTSTADERGRTKDITALSVPAGQMCLLGPFTRVGWASAGGKLFYQASAAGMLLIPLVD